MNIKKLIEIIERVPHQRVRIGVKDSKPGTYIQFVYGCKPTCVRCALEKEVQ